MEPSFVWHVIPRADVRAFFQDPPPAPATLFVALVLFFILSPSLALSPSARRLLMRLRSVEKFSAESNFREM